MKKLILTFIIAPFLLTGCIGDLLSFGCEYSDDSTHCWQSVAIQDSDPDGCEKVHTDDWPSSNPPKDKCYLIIAENTGDARICDNIKGGPGSYTRQECIDGVLRTHGTLGPSEPEPEAEIIIEEDEVKPEDPATEGLSNAEKADILTVRDALTGKYAELLDADIESETDPSRKAGLEAYRDFLGKAGETIEEAQANFDKLSELRRIFIDTYDAKDDIENMSVEAELDPGFFDQMKDRLLGPSKAPTGLARENADAANSLQIYGVMLEQQSKNDFVKQGKLQRLGSTIADKFKNDITEHVVGGAKEIAEDLAGTAFGAVTQVGDALQAFQDEAQNQMFLGLARAYNRRREALLVERPNLSADERHALAVKQVKEDPYRDNTQLAVVKHGNILENPDCQNDSNPLCIDNRVFWVAMDKTFRYNNK